MDRVLKEMKDDLTYNKFRKDIEDEMAEADLYEQQKEKERALQAEIQRITADHRKLVQDYNKQEEEDS